MRQNNPQFLSAALCALCVCAVDLSAQSADELVHRGMEEFRQGRIDDSIASFDAAAKADPRVEPHLWQRGISYYYAGRFDDGRKQFESHKSVNPHDVENAAWHYLCVARAQSPEAARKALIPIDTAQDARVPMKQVYELYAGRGTVEQVLEAASAQPAARKAGALFYAHLYLGLYHEANKDAAKAREHLTLATTTHAADHYMGDVARVHIKRLDAGK